MTQRHLLIALGANLPESDTDSLQPMLVRAINHLITKTFVFRSVSTFYNSPAYPKGSGPDFVNAAARFVTVMSPEAVLRHLMDVEAALGRVRSARWGPRVIDLDLIAVDDAILPDRATQDYWRRLPPADQMRLTPEHLILPHPRMQDRAFVLRPLADIAPDWVHPVTGRTVLQMLEALPAVDRAAIRPVATPSPLVNPQPIV